jgi:hypothetical protein
MWDSSIVILRSTDFDNKRFGSGFIFAICESYVYIATCAHVIKDIGGGQKIQVENSRAELIATGDDLGIDVAIVKVEKFGNHIPLRFYFNNLFTDCEIIGFQIFDRNFILRPLKCQFIKTTAIMSTMNNRRYKSFDIKVADNFSLQPGYSGSPILCSHNNLFHVIGIITHKFDSTGILGCGISIEVLLEICPPYLKELLPEFGAIESPDRKLNHTIVKKVSTQKKPSEILNVFRVKDFFNLKWSLSKFIDELIKIDYETLINLDIKDSGTIDQWLPIVENNPDGLKILVNSSNEIVGYYNFVPLNEFKFNEAMQGKLFDGELKLTDMKIFGLPGIYNIHFVIVAVKKEYRGYKTIKLLFQAFTDTLVELALNNIFIRNISATAFSEEGFALCRSLNMEYVCKHIERGDVFRLNLMNIPEPFSNNAKLVRLYEKKFHVTNSNIYPNHEHKTD